MAGTYIDDGFDRQGYIAEGEQKSDGSRLHGSLSFTYRQATRRELVVLDDEVKAALGDGERGSGIRAEDLACKFVVSKVSKWDLAKPNGEAVKVSVDALYHVHPIIFGALYNIVRGWRASDPKPSEPPETSDEDQLKN